MDGLYVACWLTPAEAVQLALDGGEPSDALHVTLAFIPGATDSDRGRIEQVVSQVAASFPPLSGSVAGLGVWAGEDGGDVLYASADVPGLEWLRADLVEQLCDAGYEIACNHGFTPHVTLAYLQPGAPADVGGWTPVPLTLDSVAVTAVGDGAGQRNDVAFGQIAKEEPSADSSHVDVPLGSDQPNRKRKPKPGDGVEMNVKVAKVDQEHRLVYGVVLEPDAVDTQGDWETPEDIAKAAHRYLMKGWQSGDAWNTVQHRIRVGKDAIVPVENFVAPCDFTYPENPDDVIRKGSWVLVAKVNSDTLWEAVKDGTFSGWSVGGTGRRIPENALPATVAKDDGRSLAELARGIGESIGGAVRDAVAAMRDAPMPDVHVHLPAGEAPVVTVNVPEREQHTHVDVQPPEVNVHVDQPKPGPVRVETAEDGSRRYIPE